MLCSCAAGIKAASTRTSSWHHDLRRNGWIRDMPLETRKWDVTEYLDTEERIALFLEAVFEDGDPASIAAAIGEVARARGMTNVARDSGLSRENLYKTLSENGNPEFSTVLKVIKALGFGLTITPHKTEAA